MTHTIRHLQRYPDKTKRVGLFCICSTVYAARVAGSPLRGARFPVRHSAARAEVPPCRQTKQLKNEVLTSNRDLTKNDLTCVSCQIEIREGGFDLLRACLLCSSGSWLACDLVDVCV